MRPFVPAWLTVSRPRPRRWSRFVRFFRGLFPWPRVRAPAREGFFQPYPVDFYEEPPDDYIITVGEA